MSEAQKGWRDFIRVHPAAELFPLMSPEELDALAADIKANDLRNLVSTWFDENGQEWLIDGRNRLDAMATLGYLFSREPLERETPQLVIHEPGHRGDLPVVHHSDVDPYVLAISFNINRRHLTTVQKLELITKLLKADPTKSDRTVAEVVKVDHKTVGAKRAALKASGEIPHLDTKRIGADGKARKMPGTKTIEPTAAVAALAASSDHRIAELSEQEQITSELDNIAIEYKAIVASTDEMVRSIVQKWWQDADASKRLEFVAWFDELRQTSVPAVADAAELQTADSEAVEPAAIVDAGQAEQAVAPQTEQPDPEASLSPAAVAALRKFEGHAIFVSPGAPWLNFAQCEEQGIDEDAIEELKAAGLIVTAPNNDRAVGIRPSWMQGG